METAKDTLHFNFFKNQKKKTSFKKKALKATFSFGFFLIFDFIFMAIPTTFQWVAVVDAHSNYQQKEFSAYKNLNNTILSDFSLKDLKAVLANSNFSTSSLQLSKSVNLIKESPLIEDKIKKEVINLYNENYKNGFNNQKNILPFPDCPFLSISCNLLSHQVSSEAKTLNEKTFKQIENNYKIINREIKSTFDNELTNKLIRDNIIKIK